MVVLEHPEFVNHKEKLLKNLGAAHVVLVSDLKYFFGLYKGGFKKYVAIFLVRPEGDDCLENLGTFEDFFPRKFLTIPQ